MIMKRIYTLILAALALLSSCTGNKKAEENVETLRIGVMPSVDHLPLAIAQEQHYFDSLGLNVELVRFTSPMERDAALQAGELDGTISDYTTVMTQNAKGLSVKLLSSTDGLFSFIVNPKSGIKTLADLKGKKVALSSNTVIEFATDQVLAKAKLEPTDITKVEVQKIPLRLEMVAKGEVDAAILPQPFAQIAQEKGLVALKDVLLPGSEETLVTGLALDSKRTEGRDAAIQKLIKGYNQGADYLNNNEIAHWAPVVAKELKVDENVVSHMSFGYFSPITSPQAKSIDAVAKWLKAKALIPNDYKAENCIMGGI